MSISRGLFKSRKTGLYLPLALYNDATHLASTGFNVTLSYSASKFAVRGLTQASGTLFGEINAIQYSSVDG